MLTKEERQELPIPSIDELKKRVSEGKCMLCQEDAKGNCYSEAGLKEFHISGFCELCFDAITEETDEYE